MLLKEKLSHQNLASVWTYLWGTAWKTGQKWRWILPVPLLETRAIEIPGLFSLQGTHHPPTLSILICWRWLLCATYMPFTIRLEQNPGKTAISLQLPQMLYAYYPSRNIKHYVFLNNRWRTSWTTCSSSLVAGYMFSGSSRVAIPRVEPMLLPVKMWAFSQKKPKKAVQHLICYIYNFEYITQRPDFLKNLG